MFQAERYVFELGGEPAGLLIGGEKGFTFHASANWAWPLDGSEYPDLKTAERAIISKHDAVVQDKTSNTGSS